MEDTWSDKVVGGMQKHGKNGSLTKLMKLWSREALRFGCNEDIIHPVSTEAAAVKMHTYL